MTYVEGPSVTFLADIVADGLRVAELATVTATRVLPGLVGYESDRAPIQWKGLLLIELPTPAAAQLLAGGRLTILAHGDESWGRPLTVAVSRAEARWRKSKPLHLKAEFVGIGEPPVALLAMI